VEEGETWKTAVAVDSPVMFSMVGVGLMQAEEELVVSLTE
jgi:hypothetical protein